MKVLVSKSSLYKTLNKIDFANETVQVIDLEHDSSCMVIYTSEQKLELKVNILKYSPSRVEQDEQRWDWLYSLCCDIEEQPIILTLRRNILKATFEF